MNVFLFFVFVFEVLVRLKSDIAAVMFIKAHSYQE